MRKDIIELFNRDLDRLDREIKGYHNEDDLWKIEKEITNSGGNLALHLIGNLNHFIGAVLGQTGYVRDREAEFNDKNIARGHLYNEIVHLKTMISKVLNGLDSTAFLAPYPINVFKKEMSTQFFLVHLYGHLNYHLGQINYHRRLLDTC